MSWRLEKNAESAPVEVSRKTSMRVSLPCLHARHVCGFEGVLTLIFWVADGKVFAFPTVFFFFF